MQSIDRIETFETDAKVSIEGTKCKDRVAVTISGGRFLAGGQEGGAWIRQEVRGTERIQRIQFWHGSLVHRLVAHGHENPRDTDSWATSHRETARDRHIRAARFTTIKMGAVGSAILFSPVNNAVDRIIAIFDFQSASVLFLFLSFPFFQPPPPSPPLLSFVSRNRFALSGQQLRHRDGKSSRSILSTMSSMYTTGTITLIGVIDGIKTVFDSVGRY